MNVILVNIKSNITFFLTPSEIMKKKINSYDKIRIGGLVKKESVIILKKEFAKTQLFKKTVFLLLLIAIQPCPSL